MIPHSSFFFFFSLKRKSGEAGVGDGGVFFLCRLCDDTEDMQDKMSVIHQRQHEYQLKSSMFMNKSPQESPGEQTLQKCVAENRAAVCQQGLGILPQPNESINNAHCRTRSRGKQLIEAIQSRWTGAFVLITDQL